MDKSKVIICVTRSEEFEFDLKDGKPVEPTCSCGAGGVLRQKCPWEMGGACYRHPYANAYRQALRDWALDQKFEVGDTVRFKIMNEFLEGKVDTVMHDGLRIETLYIPFDRVLGKQ